MRARLLAEPTYQTKKGKLVKILALLAAIVVLIAGGIMTLAAPHTQASSTTSGVKSALALRLPSISHIHSRWAELPLQTGGTTNPTVTTTPTPVTSPTPSTSPTASPYPDPTSIFNNMIQVYGQVLSAHFEYVTDAEQTKIVKLHIDGLGDATCKGPSLKMKVTANETLEGTSQTQKFSGQFIQIKNKTWQGNAKGKNWKVINGDNLTVLSFPFPVSNPLLCPSAASTGGSGGTSSGAPSDQFKDLVNLGPDTFQGNAVWHLHLTDVHVDSSGQVTNIPIDLLIGQTHFFPYVFTQTLTDPANNITIVEKQVLTKFGEKVSVKAPKVTKKP